MTILDNVSLCQNAYFCLAVKTFRGTLTNLRDFRLYTCKQEGFFLLFFCCFFYFRKKHFSLFLSLELAGIEHRVQVGMLVSQIFKSACTSEQSDQTSHFLPIDRPSMSDQTAWMGTHVNLYLLLYTGSDNN